jgi:hypothetical protein
VAIERGLSLMAGSLILLSLNLAHFVSHYLLWLTAFVGESLFQSAFTSWCLGMNILPCMGLEAARRGKAE